MNNFFFDRWYEKENQKQWIMRHKIPFTCIGTVYFPESNLGGNPQ